MMVLLSMLAVGLLSLSTVSLRTSQRGMASAEARANARLALMLAIGELQKTMGPDQRVSARSSSINGTGGEPNLLGVWESWRWSPSGGGGPAYGSKQDRFLKWLGSSGDPEAATEPGFPTAEPTDAVWLVNPDTIGTPQEGDDVGPGLRAERVFVEREEGSRGALAWAVMDESQKAPIALPYEKQPSEHEIVARRTAPLRAAPEAVVPELAPDRIGNTAKLVSLKTAVLAAGPGSRSALLGRQQALTTRSVGLLTNVAEGGLRRDLTTLFESDLELSGVLGATTPYFTGDTEGPVFTEADGAPTWDYLRSHYQLHSRLSNSAAGAPFYSLGANDLIPGRAGVDVAPSTERLLPVIAKLQIMFSIVSHYQHIGDRAGFFENQATPSGNTKYGAPHLVYDPVVTLWNPYDVALSFEMLRVRIWDPPVLFGFQKGGQWLRPEFASGDYHGLARFQVQNQYNANARKHFTLLLREAGRGRGGVSGPPGGIIRLEPGEVRVFSPYVEPNWDWALETAGGYTMRAFFDWDASRDFGNQDYRSQFSQGRPPYGQLGVQAVPGWDPRAGLQTDHLSYGGARPDATKYPHDKQFPVYGNQGWLGILLDDTFSVHAKAGRTVPPTGATARDPDFMVDLLAGRNPDSSSDILRSYSFRFADVKREIGGTISGGEISRTFRIGDILQEPRARTPDGKSPFAILTMSAKTTLDPLDIGQPWVSNHPVHEGGEQDTRFVGSALDTYDLRLEEVADFTSFPGIQLDPDSNRGFFGASSTANSGVSNVPMDHVPVLPANSLGDLVTSNLVASGSLPRVTHPLGNSHAPPLIPSDRVFEAAKIRGSQIRFGRMLDHSYLLNDSLWDRYYFSTAASYSNPLMAAQNRGGLLEQFLRGERRLLNPRLVPISVTNDPAELAAELNGLGAALLGRRMASVMGIEGAFNVNTDSVDAWVALVASAREAAILGWGKESLSVTDKTGFPRFGLPLAGDTDDAQSSGSIDVAGQLRWAGFRALDDGQIRNLAKAIVEEIRARGETDGAPALTIGEFVNRRIGSPSEMHVQQGLLETAIERSGINEAYHAIDSKQITAASQGSSNNATKGEENPEARLGFTGTGAPSILTQGDLMMALAPVVTVRGDTFRIRAYGESRGNGGEILASAWCEATLQRIPEFVDPADEPDAVPDELHAANQRFGRRFEITSFRWLSSGEI